MADFFANRFFGVRYYPSRYYQGQGTVVPPIGEYVVLYQGVSKAGISGISVTGYKLTSLGDGTYSIEESTTVSDNRRDSASYEGFERV